MHFSINPRFYIVTSLYSVSSSDLFHNGSINVNFKLFLPPPLNGLHKIESISMCIKWEGCGSVFLTWLLMSRSRVGNFALMYAIQVDMTWWYQYPWLICILSLFPHLFWYPFLNSDNESFSLATLSESNWF